MESSKSKAKGKMGAEASSLWREESALLQNQRWLCLPQKESISSEDDGQGCG
ncbi:hypothetical protein Acr_21g0004380 [Actinidia rufa]|uniref:Uncharacterized protein n=1 Tax=Actinidia rufa TaxID=165716 RepID=A0A7J0GGB0_9ERIC|nr:hypothetical protein Acr_21g0004380 [Actinidia rufa]